MTTTKSQTLTTGINDALNRCRAGIEEINEVGQYLYSELDLVTHKRKLLNKRAKELRKDLDIALAHRSLLEEINIVLADAVVRADKEAKQTPPDPLGR